jgi:pimeloyl-ACP methyl ester carboxylesterase
MKKTKLFVCLVVSASFLIPVFVKAETIFEVHGADSYWYWGTDTYTREMGYAEKYIPANDQSVCVVKTDVRRNSGVEVTDYVVMSVYEGGSKPEVGTLMSKASVLGSTLPLAIGEHIYTSFNLDSCVKISKDQTYWFVLRRSHPTWDTGYFSYHRSNEYDNASEWSFVNYAQPYGWRENNSELSLILEGENLPDLKEPVIIIPGILGSELYNGDDLIWPDLSQMFLDIGDQFLTENLALNEEGESRTQIKIENIVKSIGVPGVPMTKVDIFETLIENLIFSGYKTDADLFYFPYDWRLDLNQTISVLNQKIQEIKTNSGFQKVNIIAHSMGGLLIKNYLEEYGKNDVNKLIFVGTPHLGAPKATKVLMEGDKFGIPWLNPIVMKNLSQYSISSYELMPNEKYFDVFSGYIKNYSLLNTEEPLNYAETNAFLLKNTLKPAINEKAKDFSDKNLEDYDLSGVDVYNIAGCKTGTQAGYKLALDETVGEIKYISGDGTVPLVSADYINIPAEHKFYVKNGDHAELPSTEVTRNLILDILNGMAYRIEGDISYDKSFCNFKGKEMLWKSPVEVHIYDSQGRHTGPIENEGIEYGIPGVDYEIIGHEKFVFMPTDSGETYSIVARGLDTGIFDLLISENNNGQIGKTEVYNDVPVNIASTIKLDISENSQNNQISIDEDGTGNFETKISDSTIESGEVDDLTPPQTTINISGTKGINEHYISDLSVELTSTDNESGVLKTLYSIDGGETFNVYLGPIAINQESIVSFKYYSIDKVGNNEEIKTEEIKIDKTAPEIKIKFNMDTKEFDFSVSDNLDLNPTVSCTAKKCEAKDNAGNNTVLNFKKEKLLTLKTLQLTSVVYNKQSSNLKDNVFIVNLVEMKKKIQVFNQIFMLKGQEINRISYNRAKNQSLVVSLINKKFKYETFSGFKFLHLETSGGIIKTSIK